MQDEVFNIAQTYPWASEYTANALAEELDGNAQTRMYIAGLFTQSVSKTAYTDLLQDFKKLASAKSKEKTADDAFYDSLKGATKSLSMSNVDGLGSIANFATEMGKAADELGVATTAAGWIDRATKNSNRVFRGLGSMASGATRFAGSALGVGTGISAFAATFINAQDKLIKNMIDIGLADSNVSNMTQLRRDAASLGMGFDEYSKMLQVSANITASTGETAIEGAIELGKITRAIANDKNVNMFGMRTSEVSTTIASLAEQLYNSNQISSLDNTAKDKIIDVFKTTQSIALALATTTGINRKEMLAQLEQMRTDEELKTTFAIEQENYIKEYGQESFNNFKESTETYLAFLASTMGQDSPIYAATEATLKAAAHDISYDREILNNMTDEMRLLLQEIGPDTFQMFVDQTNNILSGKTTAEQAVVDGSELLNSIATAGQTRRRLFSYDPLTQAANATMTRAQLTLDSARDITLPKLQQMIDGSIENTQFADDSIKTIDNMSIAMMTTLEAMLPGLDTMDATLDAAYYAGEVASGIIRFVMETVGYQDYGNTLGEIEKRVDEIVPTDMVLYEVGTEEYNAAPAGMRSTPNGPITATSFSAYQAATSTMLTTQQIKTSTSNTLQERLGQLQETLTDLNERTESGLNNPNSRARTSLSDARKKQLMHMERLVEEQIARITEQLSDMSQSEAMEGAN